MASSANASLLRTAIIFAVVISAWSGLCAAQSGDSSSPLTFHPLAFGPGNGGISNANADVNDVRIQFYVPILKLDDRSWGLRLKVTLYAGVYDLFVDNDIIVDQLRFASFGGTLGGEFLLPVGDEWLLKPYAEGGYIRDFDDQLGFGLWGVGIRTLAEYPVHKFDLSVGTRLGFLSVIKSDLGLEDRFGEFEIGGDANHPLGFTIAGNEANLSLYYIYRYYFDARIDRPDAEPLTLEANHEIGLTFGTDPKIKLWVMKLPRIGLGYRWGKNVRGVRLSFGFPF